MSKRNFMLIEVVPKL